MAQQLQYLKIPGLLLKSGKVQDVSVSYQTFGRPLHTAPIVLVNHALTGNSSILQWWHTIVGPGKALDTHKFTLLALDIPGNGYDGDVDHLIYNYQDWCLGDVGHAFAKAISQLGIDTIEIGVGGSIGGALLWEMLAAAPDLFKTIIPIAADWKATDWLIACCHVQEAILETSDRPLDVARQHAMTFYRSPQGLNYKFNRRIIDGSYTVKQWLHYHGRALQQRFQLPAYRLLNRLLWTTNATRLYNDDIEKLMAATTTAVELISIDSDGFFTAARDVATYNTLKTTHDIKQHTISSIHGHDAFLIEHDQVHSILKGILERRLQTVVNDR